MSVNSALHRLLNGGLLVVSLLFFGAWAAGSVTESLPLSAAISPIKKSGRIFAAIGAIENGSSYYYQYAHQKFTPINVAGKVY